MAPVLGLFGYSQSGTGVDPRTYGGTFSRAGTATYLDASGVVQTAATGEPRYQHYDSANLSLGSLLLLEGSRANGALWNRDFTNVAWVPTNITPLKDQVGADGVANSASSLLATAANATILQTIVLAAATRATSAYVKRLVGTGTINMTTDGGLSWTAITLTAAWTWVNIPAQSFLNPVFGFRIVTSGDKIAVDYFQNEAGASQSSVIATTTVAVTRAADSLSFPFLPVPQAMTVYVDAIDLMVAPSPAPSMCHIGGVNAGSGPAFVPSKSGGKYQLYVSMLVGTSVSQQAAATSYGSRIELRSFITVSGGLVTATIGQSTDSAAETVAADGGSITLGAGWNGAPNTRLYVAAMGDGTQNAFLALRSLKIAAGVQTMATMRTLATPAITSTTNTLSPISVTAERSWFGQPMFTIKDTGTGTTLTATATPRADQLVRLFKVTVSFSASPGGIPIQIFDGDTTILWQGYTSNTGMWFETFDFSKKPLRSSRGNELSVVVPSGGVAVVSTISWDGDFVRAP